MGLEPRSIFVPEQPMKALRSPMQVTSARLSRLAWILIAAATLVFADQSQTLQPLQLDQISSNQSVLHYRMPDYSLGQVTFSTGTYERILSPLSASLRKPGAPEIPTAVTYLAVPAEGVATVSIQIISSTVLEGVELVPIQAIQLETEAYGTNFLKNDAIYSQNSWYPAQPAVLYERAVMRDLTIAPLEVRPFQYNPVTKELRAITEMRVTVDYSQNLAPPEHPISPLFAPIYQAVIANYPEVQSDQMQRPTYLFITPNNFAVQGMLAPLTNWKHEKGFDVHVVSTTETGTTNAAIKAYIQNAYDNWPNPPDFICLVGDASGSFSIPTWTETWSNYSGEGDHPYTTLAGIDFIADAFIGRLSFTTTTQLLTIVNKILAYEKNPYMDDLSWFTRALLVGDPASSGTSTITTNRFIDEVTANFGFSNITVFSSPFPSQMSAGINQGVSFVNYRGWLGMSGWSNTQTNALNNGFMMPFVTIITCGTGSFASGQSRSEAFLSAGTPTTPKGGIAAIGTATSGTHTLYNNCVDGGIYQGLFNERLYYAGQALARGWFNLNLNYPDDNHNYVEVFSHWNNLMGDPGLEIWTGIPHLLTVAAPDTLPLSSDYITVTVTNGIGLPVQDAWVTVLQGADVIFESGNTGADGECILPVTGIESGNLKLTVSKHNAVPVQKDIVVANLSRELAVNGVLVSDVSGNNDGQLNPGEAVSATLNVKNTGNQDLMGVSAIVSIEAGSILADTVDIGDITAGDSINISNIDFTVPANFPGDAMVDFAVSLQSDTLVWNDHVLLDVYAPHFRLEYLGEQGTSSSSFDPGEATTVVISGSNIGRLGTSNLTGTLHSMLGDIQVIDSVAAFTDGAPSDPISNNGTPFTINLSTQMTVGIHVPLELDLTDESGFEQSVMISLPIGTPTQYDPLGPDAGGYFCYDDSDLAYALAPTYEWNSISPANFGSGTSIGSTDHGNNQDDIHTVSLPFAFGFYGQNYSQISIASNGYIALGVSQQATFRNWRVPGALGPSPMIAGFWDDLKLGTGSGIYTYFDAVNHRYIVEWDRMVNMFDNNSVETFQIILFDPQYYGSVDGNGDILVMYNEVHNVDAGTSASSSHGNYATVGTENQSATIGLEYTFNNTYPVSAKPLQSEMAILFTTRTANILPCPGWGRGDVNHDGYRNVQDLITTVNMIFGANPGECGLWAADMNEDSLVNISDVVIQVNDIMGLSRVATTGSLQSATFRLGNGRVILDGAGAVNGFQIDLISDTEPILTPASSSLVLRIGKTPIGYRIIGYWTGTPEETYSIARVGPGQVALDQALVADRSGQSVMAKTAVVPDVFKISRVFPNPFNPSIRLEYNLPEQSSVKVTIYNQLGQVVNVLVNQTQSAGHYSVRWNGMDEQGRRASSGLYLAKVQAGDKVRITKLTLMR